jgi:hypothetical protein
VDAKDALGESQELGDGGVLLHPIGQVGDHLNIAGDVSLGRINPVNGGPAIVPTSFIFPPWLIVKDGPQILASRRHRDVMNGNTMFNPPAQSILLGSFPEGVSGISRFFRNRGPCFPGSLALTYSAVPVVVSPEPPTVLKIRDGLDLAALRAFPFDNLNHATTPLIQER